MLNGNKTKGFALLGLIANLVGIYDAFFDIIPLQAWGCFMGLCVCGMVYGFYDRLIKIFYSNGDAKNNRLRETTGGPKAYAGGG